MTRLSKIAIVFVMGVVMGISNRAIAAKVFADGVSSEECSTAESIAAATNGVKQWVTNTATAYNAGRLGDTPAASYPTKTATKREYFDFGSNVLSTNYPAFSAVKLMGLNPLGNPRTACFWDLQTWVPDTTAKVHFVTCFYTNRPAMSWTTNLSLTADNDGTTNYTCVVVGARTNLWVVLDGLGTSGGTTNNISIRGLAHEDRAGVYP